MNGKPKPLQPSEVPSSWRGSVQWDMERKYKKGKGFYICVQCPLCSKLHWSKETTIRTGRCNSPNCQGCNNRQVLTIDEVPDRWKSLIVWDKKREKDADGKWAVWAKCSVCGKQRLISETRLRAGDVGSGMCRLCTVSQKGPKSSTWRGGRSVSRQSGYINVNIHGLTGKEYELASQMCGVKSIVREHRLVMAMHLGRPLTEKEIVHHKDGNRKNNRIENLELLTKEKHFKGHGNPYYQKWQEALSHIRELEATIEILKG